MAKQPRFLKTVVKKLVSGAVVGMVLVGTAWGLAFPPVFMIMFAAYAVLGTAVFIILDAPSLKPISGAKAVAAILVFYLLLCAVYIGGGSLWPQYDPNDEKGKIEKLLKAKREKFAEQQPDELIQRAAALEAKVQDLMTRLDQIAPPAAPAVGADGSSPAAASTGGSLLARGREVYDLYECYNCHKIGGQGGVKKRGPHLDNIGSFLTKEDIKRKVFDPTYLYAEGFEEEHKKGRMPDKYKDLMTDEEINALAAYLSTMKSPAVETPKPVFVKTKVEHGFTVYGYIRDKAGKGIAGVEVKATPLKTGGHAGTTKTNNEGYYEIFLHLHNEDAGTKIQVSAGGAQQEFVATYDPNDKVTKRQQSLDLTVQAG